MQANAKTIEGAQHSDRDSGDPVISVDSKKKELIGDYKNAGHEWQPVRVKMHDFPGQAEHRRADFRD